MLSAVDRCREKISLFSLKVSSWWKDHTPEKVIHPRACEQHGLYLVDILKLKKTKICVGRKHRKSVDLEGVGGKETLL